MTFFQKLFGKKRKLRDKEQWITIYFPLSNGEYGSQDERDSIHRFTNRLDEQIRQSGAGVFDGDEFGNGEGALFMYGPDANKLFSVIEPLLQNWAPLRGGYVIKRYGAADSERIQF